MCMLHNVILFAQKLCSPKSDARTMMQTPHKANWAKILEGFFDSAGSQSCMLRCSRVDFMLIIASIIEVVMMKNETWGQFFDML